MPSRPASALIIVGHGSTVNPDSSAPTWAHAEAIRRRDVFAEVRTAFWKEEPSLRQVLYTVESDDVYVVPDFVSEGYFTQKVIPRELGLTGPITLRQSSDGVQTIKYCKPVGNHVRMTEVLLHRAAEVAPGVPPERTCLIIAGHGTELDENSAVAVKRQVDRIRELGRYAQVLAAFMEEAPRIADWTKLTAQPNVVVVPFFVADGLHSFQQIPVLLGIEIEGGKALSKREVFRRNPHRVHGRSLYYASAIGTEPLFAEVILDQVAAFDAQLESGCPELEIRQGRTAFVDEAFGRWLAAGGDRVGQVAIRRSQRGSFILTHCEEASENGRESNGVEVFNSPLDALELAKFDDSGEYRPLKSAPNLRHGWRLELQGAKELSAAIDFFYPAMRAMEACHRRGRLEPVTLRETLNRQSGMFAPARKLSNQGANRVAVQCCHSGGACLKSILWSVEPGLRMTTLPPEKFDPAADQLGKGGAHPFPLLCPEACNLFVAAARKEVKRT